MNKLLKWIYISRARFYAKKLQPLIKEGNKVLDIGAGSGYLAEILSKKANVTMIDICDYNQTDLPLLLYEGNKLPFPDNLFDVGLFITVLHHTPNPPETIREAKRVCKRVIIIEEVYSSILSRLHMDLWEWFWNKTSRITTFYNFHSKEEWMRIFKELNFKVNSSHSFRSSLKNLEMNMYDVE